MLFNFALDEVGTIRTFLREKLRPSRVATFNLSNILNVRRVKGDILIRIDGIHKDIDKIQVIIQCTSYTIHTSSAVF